MSSIEVNRRLVSIPFQIRMFDTRRSFTAHLKRMGITDVPAWIGKNKEATVHEYNDDVWTYVFVCVKPVKGRINRSMFTP